ncbi:hypothetical protein AVEN_207057-1 [Araneus ventricosus]|uniref:Uncharacterized protein n=1 Tax=Araneus ventricosus TaxID=182803 RepID=A0A4Y2UJF7_ARAVE|nr:hypothetical protein AVEN_207057-1 [Araneus ventricosus]
MPFVLLASHPVNSMMKKTPRLDRPDNPSSVFQKSKGALTDHWLLKSISCKIHLVVHNTDTLCGDPEFHRVGICVAVTLLLLHIKRIRKVAGGHTEHLITTGIRSLLRNLGAMAFFGI